MAIQSLKKEPLYQTFDSPSPARESSCARFTRIFCSTYVTISLLAVTGVFGILLLRSYWIQPEIIYDCLPEESVVEFSFISQKQQLAQEQINLKEEDRPNILVFLADDLGYGDLASYGHATQPWGPLDELASNGMRFTQFYADALCSPSRAQFLTGRLPIRVGITGGARVFQQSSSGGLPESEITIPELLRDNGYATGMNGKWHLGINCKKNNDGCHLPFHHGFDFVGTYYPHSNVPACDRTGTYQKEADPQQCFLYRGRGTSPWQAPSYRENLTETLLQEAKGFISKNAGKPWFLYFASPQIHEDVYASKKFRGSTSRGGVGDTIAEMSWAAGELAKHLITLGLSRKTLFFFFSDNGASVYDCQQSGNNGPLHGAKAQSWEGGHRVPAFAWWPGKVPSSSLNHDVIVSTDLMPTIAKLAGVEPPSDRTLDGFDISSTLFGDNTAEGKAPKERSIFYYCSRKLMAARHGQYKAHFWTWIEPATHDSVYCSKTTARPDKFAMTSYFLDCSDEHMVKHNPPLMYDIESDPSELYPLDPTEYAYVNEGIMNAVEEHRGTLDLNSIVEQGITHKLDEQFVKHQESEFSMEWSSTPSKTRTPDVSQTAHLICV